MNSKSEYSRCRVPRLRLDMEGWSRLKEEQKTSTNQRSLVVDAEERDLIHIEEEQRRKDSKRAGGPKIDAERPKKKRKVKLPRLEDWGESKEQEGDMDNTTTTIKDCLDIEVNFVKFYNHVQFSESLRGPVIASLARASKNSLPLPVIISAPDCTTKS